MTAETLEELRRRGHAIGTQTGIKDGKVATSIDGALYTFEEADAMLAAHLEAERKADGIIRTGGLT